MTFLACKPQYTTITFFYGQNQLLGTWVALYKLFQVQMTLLEFLGKSTCKPSLVSPKNRIQCVISRLENPQKENLIEFYWYWNYIYWKSLDLWQQPVRKYKRYFYCEKRAQRTWTLQFLETCGKLYLGLTNIYNVILMCLIK